MQPIKVMIVDDHQAVRDGLVSLLETCDEIQVVGQAAGADDAICSIEELRPDVLLLDLRLPGCDGLDLCRTLQAKVPETRVIMLTSYPEENFFLEALEVGASGCLSKTANIEEMVEAVQSVVVGRQAWT